MFLIPAFQFLLSNNVDLKSRNCLFFIKAEESGKASVISLLYIRREKTGRKFTHFSMVMETLTTDSLSRAGLITTIANFKVLFQ